MCHQNSTFECTFDESILREKDCTIEMGREVSISTYLNFILRTFDNFSTGNEVIEDYKLHSKEVV